jgi:hypothetical protein
MAKKSPGTSVDPNAEAGGGGLAPGRRASHPRRSFSTRPSHRSYGSFGVEAETSTSALNAPAQDRSVHAANPRWPEEGWGAPRASYLGGIAKALGLAAERAPTGRVLGGEAEAVEHSAIEEENIPGQKTQPRVSIRSAISTQPMSLWHTLGIRGLASLPEPSCVTTGTLRAEPEQ